MARATTGFFRTRSKRRLDDHEIIKAGVVYIQKYAVDRIGLVISGED
jgi:hypothetical protein